MNVSIVGLGLIGVPWQRRQKPDAAHRFQDRYRRRNRTLARLSGAIDAPLTDEGAKRVRHRASCDPPGSRGRLG